MENQTGADTATVEVEERKQTPPPDRFVDVQLDEGKIINGRVVSVTRNEVFVDVGYKSEGIIPIGEFFDLEGNLSVKVNEHIKIMVVQREDNDGNMVLSKRRADEVLWWERIQGIFERRDIIQSKVLRPVKGGLLVDLGGLSAFLPLSHLMTRAAPDAKPEDYIGKVIQVRVLKVGQERGSVVVSHRIVMMEEKALRRHERWQELAEGQRLPGTVKTLVPYGAFVDVGGIDGLLHVNDLSWSRLGSPEDVLSIGQSIDVMVLKIDRKSGKISLGMKQLTADPWVGVQDKFPIGKIIQGKVMNLVDYGAFVKLEEGVEGLVHISEMSWSRRPRHPSQFVAIGDNIEAVVLSVDRDARRLSLGLKQLEPDPWSVADQRFPVGAKVKGTVKTLADFGAFVELGDGVEGLLHASDLSWTRKVGHPGEVLKKGGKVDVLVLRVDKEHKRIALGFKQLQEDPWIDLIPEKFSVGTSIAGTVVRFADLMAFVDLEGDVEGVVHATDVSLGPDEALDSALPVGTQAIFEVLKIDPLARKLSLTVVEKKGMAPHAAPMGGESVVPPLDSGPISASEPEVPHGGA